MLHLPTKAAIVAGLGDASFILATIAGLSYELGPIADLFPPKLKAGVVATGLFCTAALRITQRLMERAQGVKDAQGIAEVKDAAGLPPDPPK